MIFTGWFLVNIVGPIFLPVVGILPLRLLPLGPANMANVRMMATVKDGQLCWAVIAMGASTIYELWEALESKKSIPSWGGFALAGTILVMLPAMLLAAGGAVFSTPLISSSTQGLTAWLQYYKVFVGSAIMAIVASFAYTNMHLAPRCLAWVAGAVGFRGPQPSVGSTGRPSVRPDLLFGLALASSGGQG